MPHAQDITAAEHIRIGKLCGCFQAFVHLPLQCYLHYNMYAPTQLPLLHTPPLSYDLQRTVVPMTKP